MSNKKERRNVFAKAFRFGSSDIRFPNEWKPKRNLSPFNSTNDDEWAFLEGNSCTRKRNIFMIKVCCLVICLSFPSLPSAKGGGTLNYPLTESHSLFVHPIIYTYFSLFSFLPFLLFLQYT